LWWGNKTDS